MIEFVLYGLLLFCAYASRDVGFVLLGGIFNSVVCIGVELEDKYEKQIYSNEEYIAQKYWFKIIKIRWEEVSQVEESSWGIIVHSKQGKSITIHFYHFGPPEEVKRILLHYLIPYYPELSSKLKENSEQS